MTDDLRREAARLMGKAKSRRKSNAVKENGKKGGRPKNSRDSYKRTRRPNSAKKTIEYDPEYSQE